MHTKITYGSSVLEIKTYGKLNLKGGGKMESKGGIHSEENYKSRQRKRREMIRWLAIENFKRENAKFLTLTFRDTMEISIKDPKQCDKKFAEFTEKLRREFKEIKYMVVKEFQDKNDRGAVHYHMLVEMPYCPKTRLEFLWSHGYIKVNRIRHVDNLGAYIVKYMASDMDDKRLAGIRAYEMSKNLKKPNVIKSWTKGQASIAVSIMEALEKETPCYSAEYQDENAELITISQYNFSRKGQKYNSKEKDQQDLEDFEPETESTDPSCLDYLFQSSEATDPRDCPF